MIAFLAALPLALAPALPDPAPAGLAVSPASSVQAPGGQEAGGEDAGGAPVGGQAGQGERVPPVQQAGDTIILNFEESGQDGGYTLEEFVKHCQVITGINFTYSKETQQLLKSTQLKMFGPKTIPRRDFYSFFQIMMIINDFVCSQIGPDHLSVVLVQSLASQARGNLRQNAVYVNPEDIDLYADQPATLIITVINLPNTDVRTLSNSMRSMITDAQTQQIIPVGQSNALILSGFGSNVAALARMLRLVDEASAAETTIVPEFEVLPLEFAAADEIADTIEELLDASRRAVQAGRQVQQAQGVSGTLQTGQAETKIMVDPRTNSLLVMAMPDDMPRIKELVARLDVDIVERERNFRIYALRNVNAEDLAEVLEEFLQDASRIDTGAPGQQARAQAAGGTGAVGGSRNDFVVVPDPASNSLLVAASRTRAEEVFDLIELLDQRQDQVLIETALIELTGRDFVDIGVELGFASIPGGGDEGGFGVTGFDLSTFVDNDGDGVPDTRVPNVPLGGVTAGILSGDDFSLPLLVSLAKERRDTNVLNVPSVLVNNNGTARVSTLDEQPTTQVTALGGGGAGGVQTQENFSEYVEAGITLEISPSISASRYLRLDVFLEVSTFLGSVQGAIPPPRITRTIDTTVSVPDGDTMVIGGIIVDNKTRTRNSVPWLGDLPVLGFLFRRDSDSVDKTTLYFFVTPHIMRDKEFADLAEYSFEQKLQAADAIGADRVRVVDPTFGRDKDGVDLSGFQVPLYQNPERGETDGSDVGVDPLEVRELLDTTGQPPADGDEQMDAGQTDPIDAEEDLP